MAGFFKGALCAAAAIVATAAGGPADAAGFIRYDVATLGQEFRAVQAPWETLPRYSSAWVSYIFSVVVPVDQVGPWTLTGSSYSSAQVHNFLAGSTGITAGASSIAFAETSAPSLQYSSAGAWGEISGSTCVAAGNAFVTSGFVANCGTVSSNTNSRFAQTRFTGGVVDVRVSTGTGVSADGYGILAVQSVPLVPEPATWAMMTLGLGMAGYALRRRRHRIAAA